MGKSKVRRCPVCDRVYMTHGKVCPACRQQQYRNRKSAQKALAAKQLSMETWVQYEALAALSPELKTLLDGIYSASDTALEFDAALRRIAIGVTMGMEIARRAPTLEIYRDDEQ